MQSQSSRINSQLLLIKLNLTLFATSFHSYCRRVVTENSTAGIIEPEIFVTG